ncbi:hypothetical protein AMK06_CH02011 [Rhizobium sp. N541]|uniref:hypothetical protein n=1 Tax=unclassified Rhizobium TaxID=2613769 RepID=UPI0007EE6414|nr:MULTISPECIES: hypothetical protein [unclassified Rhizobium]ANM16911.1 hypothetical protein AMK06_CH02011 [Rhizobium sp. N541]ANM23296.1 hypothetical protein AMK07_CH02008 [Rhizobium sp. N941]
MAYQFIHLESWSRKPDDKGRSTDFVFDEASRRPGACVHVAEPKPPTVSYGVGVDEVRQMHDAAAAAAMTPGARGKLRKLDSKQKTLHTVVASHPYTVEEVRADPKKATEIRDWERRTVAWLREQYGSALKSVVRHTDERQWHIHAYVLPTHDPQMRAGVYHPGVVAKKAVKAAGARDGEDGKALNKRADAAYKAAMRDWQDSYHNAVAVPCGLTRLGPARRRLTREEWKAEQAQAAALKNAVERAAVVKRQGQAYIGQTRADAAAIKADAAQIKASAARLAGIGGAVRAVVDGIQESRIRAEIRREFIRDLTAAKAAAEKAKTETAKANASRREAEKRASEQRHAFRQQGQRLVAAQQEIRTLSAALAAALDEPTPTPGGVPTP